MPLPSHPWHRDFSWNNFVVLLTANSPCTPEGIKFFVFLQLLVCLRVLIRRCVYENVNKDDIQKLFPAEVLPELQRLLTILLQKFQKEWREDISKDPVNTHQGLIEKESSIPIRLE